MKEYNVKPNLRNWLIAEVEYATLKCVWWISTYFVGTAK